MAGDRKTYFFVAECPLAMECKEEDFKQWKVWGGTPTECREQLFLHLHGSGLHKQHEKTPGQRTDMYASLCKKVTLEEACDPPADRKRRRWRRAPVDEEPAPAGEPPILRLEGPPEQTAVSLPLRNCSTSSSTMMAMSSLQMKEYCEQAVRAVRAAECAYRTSSATGSAFAVEIAVFRDNKNYAEAALEDANGDT